MFNERYLETTYGNTHEKPFNFNLCGYQFKLKNTLMQHMIVHSDEKAFKCNFYDFSSAWRGELKIHMRIHTGEKPFKCNFCSLSSARKSCITVHVRRHSGEKTYNVTNVIILPRRNCIKSTYDSTHKEKSI